MSLLFTPTTLPSPDGGLVLPNRIVIAPMCQYQAVNGEATDWHLMHWGNLLNSGAAMFTIEATGVLPEGRITPACLGLWDDRTEAALAGVLTQVREFADQQIHLFLLADDDLVKLVEQVFLEADLDFQFGQAISLAHL